MGEIYQPLPVKLFLGVIFSDPQNLPAVRRRVEAELGPVELESPVYDFDYTNYYEKEMGPRLGRQFWALADLRPRESLPEFKLTTNNLESEFASEEKRTVNLDPGYLSEANLVLASTKNFYHRLYLGRGIYGEVTLIYRKGGFESLPWTYPDYRDPRHQRFFLELRSLYRTQLKARR